MSKIFKTIPVAQRHSENSSSDESYRKVLNLLPTLQDEIRSAIDRKAFRDVSSPVSLSDLPDNSAIVSLEAVEAEKIELQRHLQTLSEILNGKAPIVVVRDDCFTNDLLTGVLKRILGEDGYGKYVDELVVDFDAEVDDAELEKRIPEGKIVVIGGSFSDTYSVPAGIYSNHLSRIIRENVSGGSEHATNNRFLWVCFGQQYLANLVGIEHIDSTNVIATVKGSAQFGPSSCRIGDLRYGSPVVAKAFAGLSNFGKNRRFSATFTRTGHVDFDLLDSQRDPPIIPAVVDEMTGDVVGWGTKNGRIIGVQFHPEIRFPNDSEFVSESFSPIIASLARTYGESVSEIIGNFDPELFAGREQRDIAEPFYTFALSALASDLVRSLSKKIMEGAVTVVQSDSEELQPNYPEAVMRLIGSIHSRVFNLIERRDRKACFSEENRFSMLHNIDQAGKLEFVRHLDWKVNRTESEYAEILGFRNLAEMTLSQKGFLEGHGLKSPFVFCDFGAGNGTFLEDAYKKLSGNDIVFFGVADRIYFDLYQWMVLAPRLADVPDQLKMLFVQKVAHAYAEDLEATMLEKLSLSISEIEFLPGDKIELSSMFTNRTLMFSGDQVIPLSGASRRFLRENPDILDRMKSVVTEDAYALFHGFFERIYLSDFHDFGIDDACVGKEHFRVAVRSTSHVDSVEYRRAASRFITEHSAPGSVFLDNGVHRSYSSVPRLKELFEVSQALRGRTKISLVYDGSKDMDAFSCAIIERSPFHDESFWIANLLQGRQLVSIESAYHCTYFRLECFVRNFLLSNFKSYDVFWNYNKKIVSFLRNSLGLLETGRFSEIKEGLVELIETIVLEFDSAGHRFAPVTLSVLEGYVSKDGVGINDILKKPVSIPNWLRSKTLNR